MTELTLQLTPEDNSRLLALTGQCQEHFKFIAKQLGVKIHQHGYTITVSGDKSAAQAALHVLQALYAETATKPELSLEDVHLSLQVAKSMVDAQTDTQSFSLRANKALVKSRGENQMRYLQNILVHDINFGIGPAGTGKTYLAVACAVEALSKDIVNRIILVRPAVEAGENLGFLPGDLAQKVDPYLRPLYDALYEMMGFEHVDKLIERNVIEVAPLAFMRGRTLNHSFIILDESQNTTVDQMKMFLTRIGFGSKAVVTGDITQIDLASNKESGLKHAMAVLNGIDAISFTHFEPKDVVRHALVQKIVEAYERYKK